MTRMSYLGLTIIDKLCDWHLTVGSESLDSVFVKLSIFRRLLTSPLSGTIAMSRLYVEC